MENPYESRKGIKIPNPKKPRSPLQIMGSCVSELGLSFGILV